MDFNNRIQVLFRLDRSTEFQTGTSKAEISVRTDRTKKKKISILFLIAVAFGSGFGKSLTYTRPSAFPSDHVEVPVSEKSWFHSCFVSTGITRMVHSASVVELDHGKLRAFWFAGSREGDADVEIQSAVYDPERLRWSTETTVQTRSSVQTDLHRHIRKLGNPVAIRGADGKIWLFFVSTSIGGWSTSSINMTTSTDNGETWAPVRRLITSPFLNLSTLVKTPPFFYQDGILSLPIYHEFVAKYGEILHLDSNGNVLEKLRLNDRWRTIQPLVLLDGKHRALTLMRYSGDQKPRKAIQVVTEDAGRHWSEPIRSSLPNPDSALAGMGLGNGRMIVVINNHPQRRNDLTLMVSNDSGRIWRDVFSFEALENRQGYTLDIQEYTDDIRRLFLKTDPNFPIDTSRIEAVRNVMCGEQVCRYRFDYPYLIRARNGNFHLLYTWNRTYIKHIEFNQAWLEEQIRAKGA